MENGLFRVFNLGWWTGSEIAVMIASIYHFHKHLKAARSLKICKLYCTYPYPIFTSCRHSLTLHNIYILEYPAQVKLLWVRNEYTNCQLFINVQENPVEVQHTETWSSAAQLPCHLCFCLAVFFCHLLITLSCPQGKIWHTFQRCYFLICSPFFSY